MLPRLCFRGCASEARLLTTRHARSTQAASLAPTRRNLYYVGVNAFQLGEFKRAASFFEKALKAQCGSATEMDFGEFLTAESRTGLARAKKALAEESSA